jgi:hypothetical protein
MASKPFSTETKIKLSFFGSTALLGLVAMIQPRLVYDVLGFLLAIAGILLLVFYGVKLWQYYAQYQQFQQWIFSQFFIVFFLVVLFILIPARSLSFVVSLVTLIGLLAFTLYTLYIQARYFAKRLTIIDWALGLGSLGLAILVLFNLNETPNVIMFFIGGIVFYVSGSQLFKALLDHASR